MSRLPKVVPWKSSSDLASLRDWFYPLEGSVDMRRRAVARVKAYQTRGSVPHSIESTALLVSALLSDDNGSDSNTIRLAYSMALIRFVNGLLDPYQKSQFAIPLHTLAKNLGLPSFFVELRHAATHEGMPSLELLRESARRALDWLWTHYWMLNGRTEDSEGQQQDDRTKKDALKELFREWRRLRRSDPVRVVKRGDRSEYGVAFWKLVAKIQTYLDNDLDMVNEVLWRMNVLIPRENSRTQSSIVLFAPLLDVLNKDGFVQKLCLYAIDLLKSQPTPFDWIPISFDAEASEISSTDPQFYEAVSLWIKHFVTPRNKPKQTPWLADLKEIMEECFVFKQPFVEILQYILDQNPRLSSTRTEELLTLMKAQTVPKTQEKTHRKFKGDLLDEIDKETDQFAKRFKSISSTDTIGTSDSESVDRPESGWVPMTNWTSKPLACI